jgi:DNA N-6-adenine-methyltransferase (Dam)
MSDTKTLAPARRRATTHRSTRKMAATVPATRTAQKKRVRFDRNPPSATTTTWLTPRSYIDALGPFDLDPCTPDTMPWRTAARMLTKADDGLATPWPSTAFVWHNPPYGRGQEVWMRKAAEHGHGITLVLARLDTQWAHDWVFNHPNTTALVFVKGRIPFCKPDGVSGPGCPVPAMFVAYGHEAAKRLERAVASGAIRGVILVLGDALPQSNRRA